MIKHLINLFFPKVCAGCDKLLLAGEITICITCRHEIPLTNHHLVPENEAYKKFYGKIQVEFVVAFMYFHKRGIVQRMIHNLKYRGQEQVGTAIADWQSDNLKTLLKLHPVDAIIPVPLHTKRLRQRGYNQVTTFALKLSHNVNIAYNDMLLFRNVYSKTQTKKNLFKRTEAVKQSPFVALFNEEHHNKHFLLIDDVLTTGSTLEACGKVLLQIPGAKISIVCIAFTH